jgi:hypothetical protein
MSVENLNRIAQSAILTEDLHKLIGEQKFVEGLINQYKTQLKDIKINYTALGITDKEFKDLCTYIDQPELLYFDLAIKEQYIAFVEQNNEQ